MAVPYLGNSKNTIEVLQKYDFVFQKKFGQNFLIDSHVLDKIVSAAGITKDDFVLEIGPGIGTMTQYLAASVYFSWERSLFSGISSYSSLSRQSGIPVLLFKIGRAHV